MHTFTKIIAGALVTANILVIAGIARADEPAPATPASVVSTFTARKVAKVEPPVRRVVWNMVQVCDASLTHCTTRDLGGAINGMTHGKVR